MGESLIELPESPLGRLGDPHLAQPWPVGAVRGERPHGGQRPARLNRRLKTLTHPALLVVDEIGYLPVTQSGAVLFFQLVNRRYGRASTVLTSNKGFEEWSRILGDEVMAVALLDRLLHRCHIVNIRGNSYRMRRHAELPKAIHPTGSRTNGESIAGEPRS